MSETEACTQWLVLVYQFPKGPGSQRVKVWRRLQAVGAVAIKNSVYVLPFNDQSQEDFAWLLTELKDGGGDGVILESRFVDGMSDQQVRDLFNAARDNDYKAIAEEIEQVLAELPAEIDPDGSATERAARAAACPKADRRHRDNRLLRRGRPRHRGSRDAIGRRTDRRSRPR